MAAASILVLSFAPSANGRERAERLVEELLKTQDLGKIAGGGEDLRTGGFDIEIATSDAETLLAQIETALETEKDLALEDAVLIER